MGVTTFWDLEKKAKQERIYTIFIAWVLWKSYNQLSTHFKSNPITNFKPFGKNLEFQIGVNSKVVLNVQAVHCIIEDFLQYLFPMTACGKLKSTGNCLCEPRSIPTPPTAAMHEETGEDNSHPSHAWQEKVQSKAEESPAAPSPVDSISLLAVWSWARPSTPSDTYSSRLDSESANCLGRRIPSIIWHPSKTGEGGLGPSP